LCTYRSNQEAECFMFYRDKRSYPVSLRRFVLVMATKAS
jgi:hypothetical protein